MILFIILVLSFAVYCQGSILQLPWQESMNPLIEHYVIKSQYWEINGFLQILKDNDYPNIHRSVSHKIDNVLYCYLNQQELIDLPSDKYDQTRLFTGVYDYFLLSRLYYMNQQEESRLLYQFPEGKFSNVLVFSLENELNVWKLLLSRLNDLNQFEFPREEKESCLSCIQSYQITTERILAVLERISKKQVKICNNWVLNQDRVGGGGKSSTNTNLDQPTTEQRFKDLMTKELQEEFEFLQSNLFISKNGAKVSMQRFIEGFLTHYRLSSLEPFLFSLQFCYDYQPYVTIHEEKDTPAGGEITYIIQKCSSLPVNKKSQASDIVQHLKYSENNQKPERIELNSYEWCTRRLIQINNPALSSTGLEMRFDPTSSVNYTAQRFFSCPKVDRLSSTRCAPSLHLQQHHHQGMIQALLTSSSSLLQGIPIKSKSSKSIALKVTGRVLIAGGLHGGELNHYLVSKFPWLSYEHIELKDSMIKLAARYFQFEKFTCFTSQLKSDIAFTTNVQGDSTTTISTSYYLEETKIANNTRKAFGIIDGKCNSNTIQADLYEYLLWKNQELSSLSSSYLNEYLTFVKESSNNETSYLRKTQELSETNDLKDRFYDYILIDRLEKEDLFNQENRQNNDQIIAEILRLARGVLRPFTGVAVIHLKKDSSLTDRLNQILDVFGKSQVVMFDVSKSHLIVAAARDRFITPFGDSNPIDAVNEGNEYHEHALYRAVSHPCISPYETIQTMKQQQKKLKMEGYHRIFSDYALNCGFTTASYLP